MKVLSCFAILVFALSAVSCCCIPSKLGLWDCKAKKLDELMDKVDFLMEKKLEMQSKLQMYKNMKQAIGFCGKLPCNCEFVFGNPIEQCRPKAVAPCNIYRQPYGDCWGY